VLALSISQAILATRQVSLFACEIGAAFPDPVYQAAAAELIPAFALRVAAGFLELDKRVAFWTGLVCFMGLDLGFAVDGRKTLSVLEAAFAGVFWSVAVGADLGFAVSAGEDSAVGLTIVRLHGLGSIAALHADIALVQRHLEGVAEGDGQYSCSQSFASTTGIDHQLTESWSLCGPDL
jgi:hypothetical protein